RLSSRPCRAPLPRAELLPAQWLSGMSAAGSGRRYGLVRGAFAADVVDLVAHHPPPQHQGEATEDPPLGRIGEVTDVQPRVLGDRWPQMHGIRQRTEGTGGLLRLRAQLPGG